jgi:hypothetical protein
VSAPGDYNNVEIGGIIGRGNRSTRRKPAPVPLCPPQTPHAARMRTRAAAVGSQRLTAELRHGLPGTHYSLQNSTIPVIQDDLYRLHHDVSHHFVSYRNEFRPADIWQGAKAGPCDARSSHMLGAVSI